MTSRKNRNVSPQLPLIEPEILSPTQPEIVAPTISNEEREVLMNKIRQVGLELESCVLINNDKNTITAGYLFVRTPQGISILLELDDEGYIPSNTERDLVMTRCEEEAIIPKSRQLMALEAVPREISSVAFVCHDNICVVQRAPEGVEVINYTESQTERRNPEDLTQEASLYPVISVRNLLAQPDEAIKIIEKAARDLKELTFKHSFETLEKGRKAINELARASQRFSEIALRYNQSLRQSIDYINTLLKPYEQKELDERLAQNYRVLRNNRALREDQKLGLILATERIASLGEQAAQITKIVEEHCSAIEGKLKTIHKIWE